MLAPNDAVGQSVAERARGGLPQAGHRGGGRPVRARHQGVHAADPAHDGAEGRRLRVRRQLAGRRRPDAQADPPGRLQAARSCRSAGRRSDEIMEIAGPAAEGSCPTTSSTGIRRPARSCGRPTRRNTARASSTSSCRRSITPVLLLVEAIKRADFARHHQGARRRWTTMNGFDAGIYGPSNGSARRATASTASLMMPYYCVRGEGRQDRHQAKFTP